MAYIFEKYINNYFAAVYSADSATRDKAEKHWTRYGNIAKETKDFDAVIYAYEHIAAIDAARAISDYIARVNVIFTNPSPGKYIFDYPDADAEYFASFQAAAAFAKYNLNEMGKIDNETC